MQEWIERRQKVLEYDKFRCRQCNKGSDKDKVLHVHHKRYIPGRRKWEYGLEDLVTLCAGCHYREHFPAVEEMERPLRDGRTVPTFGWEQFDIVDLEEPSGDCQYCPHERPIRYEHHLWHPCGEVLVSGCNHAAELTGEDSDNQRQLENTAKNYARAVAKFCDESKWQPEGVGLTRRYRGPKYFIRIEPTEDGGYRAHVNGYAGNHTYTTNQEAMKAVYPTLRNGSFDTAVSKMEGR